MDLGTRLRESARRNPLKAAVICGDETVTFAALDHWTDRLATWLLSQGLEVGDRVAIHWCNSVEVVNLYYACFKAGLIAVPVNTRLKAPEIAYILGHSKAKLCFSQPELAPMAEEVRAECPDLQHLYTSLPALTELAEPPVVLPEISPEHIAAVLYTSGTTARPKGVVHTHVSLTGSTELMRLLGFQEGSVPLAVTQMVHISALACVLLPGISFGSTVVLMKAFDGPVALDLIERWGCTHLLILPAMLRFLVEEQAHKPRKVDSVRVCVAGGDTVPVTLQEQFRSLFGISVRELFGMTETVPVTCIPEGKSRIGSIGPAMELIDARVADLTGNVLGDNQVGELQVQSPANCVGYWADAQSTANTFMDGWLRTGDLVERDEDGYFWFRGRVKQIIIRGGSNISPQEVEEALYSHPAVLEAGVIGMPDPVNGEKVVAFVALREGMKASEQELRAAVRERIADYKTPERIFFLPVLPKGLTGKVQRRALKDVAMESLEMGMAAGSS